MNHLTSLWKIATAYLVGSFALIQFVNIALPYFEIEEVLGFNSNTIMRWLFIGLPIGLPLVLAIGFFLNKRGFINNINELNNKYSTHCFEYYDLLKRFVKALVEKKLSIFSNMTKNCTI